MKKFVKLLVAALAAVVLLQVPVSARPITPVNAPDLSTDPKDTLALVNSISKVLAEAQVESKVDNHLCTVNRLLAENNLNNAKQAVKDAEKKVTSAALYFQEMANVATFAREKDLAKRKANLLNGKHIFEIKTADDATKYGVAQGKYILVSMKNWLTKLENEKKVLDTTKAHVDDVLDTVKATLAYYNNYEHVVKYITNYEKVSELYSKAADQVAQDIITTKDEIKTSSVAVDKLLAGATYKEVFDDIVKPANDALGQAQSDYAATKLVEKLTQEHYDSVLLACPATKPAEQKVEKPADKDNAKAAATEKLPSTGAVR